MGDKFLYIIVEAVSVGILLLMTILRLIVFLHMLQLEGYKTIKFINWLINNPLKIFSVRPIKNPKKKLVYTARATRLFAVMLIFLTFGMYVSSMLSFHVLVFAALFIAFAPVLLILSNVIIYPLEAVINGLYLRSAKRKIRQFNPKVIAITGSFGKTSTKDILAHILSAKYKVLKTPGSFNTPMGLCKVIRSELKAEHEVFIVEMGARNKGDIKELCELVQPEIGLITAIGSQHLETFKTVENISSTKYELIEFLPLSGIAVFNGDDENCVSLAEKTKDKKVLLYGLNENYEHLRLSAYDVSTTSEGVYFMARNSVGNAVSFHSRLLGRHNASNIMAAVTISLELGMSFNEISEIVKTLEPTPHRLQVIKGMGGVTVLDDAFNANPIGAKIALEVLAEFKGGRKALVTPGLVELGEKEYEVNKQLGLQAAQVCDFVFLVGQKRIKPIFEGLIEAGFSERNIFIEKSLSAVTERFKNILKAGDVILFENDLPDNYNE